MWQLRLMEFYRNKFHETDIPLIIIIVLGNKWNSADLIPRDTHVCIMKNKCVREVAAHPGDIQNFRTLCRVSRQEYYRAFWKRESCK
jgi:hypothetical protein